jgi:hypothetical protein
VLTKDDAKDMAAMIAGQRPGLDYADALAFTQYLCFGPPEYNPDESAGEVSAHDKGAD